MSSLTHIFGELDHPKIECQADEPCIWIRGRNDTVSLTLDRRQRDQLRAALDECDEFDKPVRTEDAIPAFSREIPNRHHTGITEIQPMYTPEHRTRISDNFDILTQDDDARRLRTIRDDMEGAP